MVTVFSMSIEFMCEQYTKRDEVRNTGIEPVPQPWEGRILPLN